MSLARAEASGDPGVRVYIAGPMTGIPSFNIPAFDQLAADLRGQGHEVVSPSELDDPATRAVAMASPDGAPGSGGTNGHTWGDFLARDVKILADGGIEAVVVLPGWEKSKGARLETFVATLGGLPVLAAPSLIYLTARRLIAAWAGLDASDILLYRKPVEP